MGALTWIENNRKRPRHGLDKWDRQSVLSCLNYVRLLTWTVLERDQRITGIKRGQSDKVAAPVGFEGMLLYRCRRRTLLTREIVSNPWKVRFVPGIDQLQSSNPTAGRATNCIDSFPNTQPTVFQNLQVKEQGTWTRRLQEAVLKLGSPWDTCLQLHVMRHLH